MRAVYEAFRFFALPLQPEIRRNEAGSWKGFGRNDAGWSNNFLKWINDEKENENHGAEAGSLR